MIKRHQDSILQNKISEIRRAINLELYNCALATALTLPDICGKVEFPMESSSKKRYKKWFNKYARIYFVFSTTKLPENLTVEYQWLSEKECYALRCAVLHAGDYKAEGISLPHIHIHAHKRDGENYNHITRDSDHIDIDVVDFCERLCKAAEEYHNSIDDKARFDLDEVRIDTW